jgi:hypothetical protein
MSRPAHASTAIARRLHGIEAPHHRARTRRHRVRHAPPAASQASAPGSSDLPLAGGVKAVPVYGNFPGLSSHTTYHFRLVAQNAFGTSYGADRAFTTP